MSDQTTAKNIARKTGLKLADVHNRMKQAHDEAAALVKKLAWTWAQAYERLIVGEHEAEERGGFSRKMICTRCSAPTFVAFDDDFLLMDGEDDETCPDCGGDLEEAPRSIPTFTFTEDMLMRSCLECGERFRSTGGDNSVCDDCMMAKMEDD